MQINYGFLTVRTPNNIQLFFMNIIVELSIQILDEGRSIVLRNRI